MKKLLLFALFIFSFALIGCDQAATEQTTQYDYSQDIDLLEAQLQAQIDAIEQQIADLQALIDNITVVEGMNGRVSYYVNKVEELTAYVQQLSSEKDYMDKSKLPDYLFDINGEFVDENKLVDLLEAKYLSEYSLSSQKVKVGYQFVMMWDLYNEDTVDMDELAARVIMLVNELRLYSFYIIGSSEIYIQFNFQWHGTVYFKFLIQTLLTDTIPMNPDILCNQWLFTSYFGINPVLANVQAYYDAYVLNGTFDGYVLNY